MSDTAQVLRVHINGVDIAYVERGHGNPIVFVHGGLGDYRTWGQQMEPFSERGRVLALSRRYHWPNAEPDETSRCDLLQHVADLAAFIEAMELAPAHVIGTSYGAMTTLTLVTQRPELFRSMVLNEPPLLPWLEHLPNGPELARAFQDSAWGPAAEAMRRGDDEAGVRLFLEGVLGAGAFERIPAAVRAGMLENAPSLRAELRTPPADYMSRVTPDDAGKVRVPALLVQGERSPAMFGVIMDELARVLPHAARITIPNASHSPHSQNAAAYNDAVLAFLERA